MQMRMPDASAVIFSREFYRSLARCWPIDACVTEGRLGIRAALHETRIDWGIPALFTRSEDGVLFASVSAESATHHPEVTEQKPDAKSHSGGISISDSTVTIHGDVAGRDVIKPDFGRPVSTYASTEVMALIRQAIRRLFGDKSP
jgi:hypothetical protein